ncbi:hypothetical protein F5883DRAFT_114978 [Diaporthe sp. PMI_573]|nr:hypothetical protein F5883DRAFT_114978 [Diaporthaceae sp. PMI_573]
MGGGGACQRTMCLGSLNCLTIAANVLSSRGCVCPLSTLHSVLVCLHMCIHNLGPPVHRLCNGWGYESKVISNRPTSP